MAKKKIEYVTPVISHDLPLSRDDEETGFHFHEYALTLSRLVAAKETRTPFTIGISGPWGSGKTTLMRQIEAMLKKADPKCPADIPFATQKEKKLSGDDSPFRACKTVWFDAWKYAGEETHLLVALVRAILNEMSRGGLRDRFAKFMADPDKPGEMAFHQFLSMFKLTYGGIEFGVDLTNRPEHRPFTSHSSFFDEFQGAFHKLIAGWIHNRSKSDTLRDTVDETAGAMVVFVDDLDRCLHEKVVQALEAIKLFLDEPGCIFVIGADQAAIREGIARTCYGQGENDRAAELAEEYLEKIIQLPFALPPIQPKAMSDYLEAQPHIDSSTRKTWEVLMAGAEVNPRKVKTFMNDLNLRWAVLVNSGQSDNVNQDDFNYWQVIARVAPDGFVHKVQDFEDIQARFNYVQAALKWARGEQQEGQDFRDFETATRLWKVLRKAEFSDEFTPHVLDSFVYLTRPTTPVQPQGKGPIPGAASPVSREIQHRVVIPTEKTLLFDDIAFVSVPAGEFLMGSRKDDELADEDEKPQDRINLDHDYFMARTPVTCAQFIRFVDEENYNTWDKFRSGNEDVDLPVVEVSWHDALAFCEWFDRKNRDGLAAKGLRATLPSEAEWEKAARGEFGNIWPWGDTFDAKLCNCESSSRTPVGKYSPQGDSPYGCADMAGNVWEWTRSLWKEYPYDPKDGSRDDLTAGNGVSRVLRGGAFDYSYWYVRCAYRGRFDPGSRNVNVGFRIVLSP